MIVLIMCLWEMKSFFFCQKIHKIVQQESDKTNSEFLPVKVSIQ